MRRLRSLIGIIAAAALIAGSTAPASAIYAGTDADISEFPWMVSVQLNDVNKGWVHECGGTLVDPEWVLTAAHCVVPYSKRSDAFRVLTGEEIRVIVGTDKQGWSEAARQRVEDPVLYPASDGSPQYIDNYADLADPDDWRGYRGDVALLRLKQPVFGVPTVSLSQGEVGAGTLLTAAGWGRIADGVRIEEYPSQLQKIDHLEVKRDSECFSADEEPTAEVQLCTKAKQRLPRIVGGPRKGDSGGPLMLWSQGRWVQLGIASHLPQWCDHDKKGWFGCGPRIVTPNDGDPNYTAWASVARFRPWINRVISAGGASPSSAVATALVIDSSGSMTSSDSANGRLQAAHAYVAASLPADEVGVVDFDSAARVAAPATRVDGNRDTLRAAIQSIDSRGGTNLGAGLQAGCDVLQSASGTRRAAIFLTDGQGSYGGQSSCFAEQGWPVFTIGLGSGVQRSVLEQIAADTGGRYLPLPTAETLACEFQQIRSEIAGLGRTSDCQPSGTIAQDQVVSFVQIVRSLLKQFTFTNVWPGSDIEMTVTSPSGRQITRATASDDVVISVGPTSESFTITRPEAGDWQVELRGADIPTPEEPYTFSTVEIPLPDSEIDSDGDGLVDPDDNCAYTPNLDQADADGDGFGDACDTDPGLQEPSEPLYRARNGDQDRREKTDRIYLERNVEVAGLGDHDPDGDGWALVGRTNGAGDNGALARFWVGDDGTPYAATRHHKKGCLTLTPKSLDPVKKGQTRLMAQQSDTSNCRSEPSSADLDNDGTPDGEQDLYRITDDGKRLYLQRSTAAAEAQLGVSDWDPDGDGWSDFARTNGSGEYGTYRGLRPTDDASAEVLVEHGRKGCQILQPNRTDTVAKGQTRRLQVAAVLGGECPETSPGVGG